MDSLEHQTPRGQNSAFLVHTHGLPMSLLRKDLCGVVVGVEREARRLRSYYGWKGPDLGLEEFLTHWPNFRSQLDLAPDCTSILTLEGAGGISAPRDLGRLWDLGLRVIQPRHWRENHYVTTEGVTCFGRELLSGMEALGFILDVSHMSGRLLTEALECFNGRIMASHTVLRDILGGDGPRANSLTAREFEGLAFKNALVGIPFVNDLVAPNGPTPDGHYTVGIDDVAAQIHAIASLVGIERVALGPDYFDFSNYSACLGLRLGVVADLDSSAGLLALEDQLLSHGLTGANVRALWRGNAERFFEGTPPDRRERALDPVHSVPSFASVHPAPFRWTFMDPSQETAFAGIDQPLSDRPTLPTAGWWSLSGHCNLSCLHCRRHYRELSDLDRSRDIPDRLYERVVAEVLPSLDSLILGGNNFSEVTRAKRFGQVVSHLANGGRRPRRISIQTNGSPVPPAVLEQLVSLDAVLNISVEGGTEETTRAIRGFPLSKLGSQVTRFNALRMAQSSHARIVLSFTAMRSNITELPALVEFAERHAVDEVNLMYLLPATIDWNQESLVHDVDMANRAIEEALSLSKAWNVCLMAPLIREMTDQRCARPWKSISINAVGDVRFCCLDDSPTVGSLLDAHLGEIWLGAAAEAVRAMVNSNCARGECSACVLRNLPFVSAAALRRQLAEPSPKGYAK